MWRWCPGTELHPFVYDYSNQFGPYKLEHEFTRADDGKFMVIPFYVIMEALIHDNEAIGAFDCNERSVVVLYPDREMTIHIKTRNYIDVYDPSASVHYFEDPIAEATGWEFIGFKRTPLLFEEVMQVPYKLAMNNWFLTDDYDGLYNAKTDPPISLYSQMIEKDCDYVYVDKDTDKPVFCKLDKPEYVKRYEK